MPPHHPLGERIWASQFRCERHGIATVDMVTTAKTCLRCHSEGHGHQVGLIRETPRPGHVLTTTERRLLRDINDGHIGLYGDPPSPDRQLPDGFAETLALHELIARHEGQGRIVWLPTEHLRDLLHLPT